MLLKTVHQWDIRNQEDLDIFTTESLEIDRSAARTLYRTDPEANPAQYEEEIPEVDNSKRQTRRRVTGTEGQSEKLGSEEKPKKQASKKKPKPQPPLEEEEQEPDEKLWKLWIMDEFPSREEFLNRLNSDLEHRQQPQQRRKKKAKCDGFSIVVKAIVEHQDGKPIRAEFVETEGMLLAHLPDPNSYRILIDLERGAVVEDSEGNIRETRTTGYSMENCRIARRNTIDLLMRTDLDMMNTWDLMSYLCREELQEFPENLEYAMEEQRERLARQLAEREEE